MRKKVSDAKIAISTAMSRVIVSWSTVIRRGFIASVVEVPLAARRRFAVRLFAVWSLIAMVFTGCVSVTALPPDTELVAPLPGPGCELAYQFLTQRGILVRHESTAA
jgi:hypothetical protein